MKTILRIIAAMAALSLSACSSPRSVTEVLSLRHGPGNARNGEGDFVTLRDGSILYVYTHFYGGDNEDHGAARLVSRISRDGGRTWSTEDRVEVENDGRQNVHSVSLLPLKDGRIAIFYLLRNSYSDLMPMMRVSDNDAQSWSEARPCITDTVAYCVMNNARVVRTSTGRIVLPIAMHPSRIGEDGAPRWQENADLCAVWSDDEGESWHRGSFVPNPGNVILQEPGVVELGDGRLMMYSRTRSKCQYRSFSADGGETWSLAEPTDIPSPCSPATIEPLPGGKGWLLVWNNNPDGWKRTPLTLAISRDEGATWENLGNLEEDPEGWYCYTAVHFIGRRKVLLGYTSTVRTPGEGLNGLEDCKVVLIEL